MFKKCLFGILGLFILSIGLNIMLSTNLGLSAFDSFNAGLTEILKNNISSDLINFGNISFFTHFIAIIIIVIFRKKMQINFNGILLSLFTAFSATRIVIFVSTFIPKSFDFGIYNWFIFLGGLFLLIYGVSLYVIADIFVPPIDKVVIGFATMFKVNFGKVKFIFDFSLLFIGFAMTWFFKLSVNYTLATLIITFATGPIVNLFYNINNKIFKIK